MYIHVYIYIVKLLHNYLLVVLCAVVMYSEVKLAMYMTIVTHLMACGWFIIACSSMTAGAGDPHTCGRDSWAMKMYMLDGSDQHLSMFTIHI